MSIEAAKAFILPEFPGRGAFRSASVHLGKELMLSFHLDVPSHREVSLHVWQFHADMDDVNSAKSCKRGNAAMV